MMIPGRLARIFAVLATSGLLSLVWPGMAKSAQEERAKRVLIISTGSRLAPGFVVADQQLLRALSGVPRSIAVETYAENLDLVRFSDEHYQRMFTDYLNTKYADQRPDLVILVFVGNLAIPGKLLPRLFPSTPIIVAGFTEEELKPNQFGPMVGGVAQRINPGATLGIMLRLQPELRRIVVIGGTAEIDRGVLQRVKEAAESFKAQVEFEYWDHLTAAELRQRVAAMPAQSAILYSRMFRDVAGQAVISSQMAQSISQWSNVPVYVMSDANFGAGAVGGAIASIESFAYRAGELARGILLETEKRSPPFEIRTDSVPTFDWRALQRWGIPEGRLPSGSAVRFKPPSIWEEYRAYVIIALIVIVIQAALILDLLLQRRGRRRAEESLAENRQFMELATEAGGVGLWVRDMAERTLWANPRLRGLLGFEETEELSIEKVSSRIHPEDRPKIARMIEEAQQAETPFEVEFRTLPNGAPPRWIVASGRSLRDSSGQLQRRMGTMIDVTARKEAEEKLWESESNFRRLVESTSAMIWQADPQTTAFTYVGPQASDMLGYPVEHWYDRGFWRAHIHPDDRDQTDSMRSEMLDKTGTSDVQYRMITASGEVLWVHEIARYEKRNGRPELRGVMLDITERKRAEQAIRESEERFRIVADAAPVMIRLSDVEQRCIFVNKGWLAFTGRSIVQELGHGWTECVHPDDLDRLLKIQRTAFEARQEYTLEYRLSRHDGAYRWVYFHGVPRFESDGTFLGYIGAAADITERKQAEEALSRERQFLRQVIDINPNLIFAKDREGRFTLASRAVAEVYGTSVENLLGKTDADFNANADEVAFFHQIDLQVIETGEERFIAEERITDSAGQVRWLQTTKRPIVNPDGSVDQLLGTSTDITQRKATELELRDQRAELAHVARISTMGELAASLAHELNQPLTAILANAQAALRFMSGKRPMLDDIREILQDIVKDNSRAGEVIRRMRSLVKKGELELTTLDLPNVVREVVLLVHSDAILLNVALQMNFADHLPPVRGDKVQIQQVVLNLLLNAFDAMKPCPHNERVVDVSVQRVDGWLETAVRDLGTGLSGDKLDKIFQPFYTTKRDGLGMGLSICRSIIEAHGGRLWAENNSDRGATFYFTLPVASSDS